VLAYHDLETPAHIIAERYKARWGIERSSMAKQNLKIRKSFRRSENAVNGADIFTGFDHLICCCK